MFKDIMLFFKSLSFIDYVFFFTVVFLIVLIVSLIYFIRVNEDVIVLDETLDDPDNLKAIAGAMKKEEKKPIKFTSYEQEQEDKAIISYDELLSNTGQYELNYANEETKGDISVKQFDLNNLVNPSIKTETPKTEIHVISLKKEEEFLEALKQLQKFLN